MQAVFYTGEVRTIKSVIDHFKKNVLINDNIHVFAVLQSDDILYHDHLVKKKLGFNLKYLRWFNKLGKKWVKIRDDLCSQMHVNDHLKNYLCHHSGSMIEYYQMYLAYLDMKKYEEYHSITYNFIYRIRCDCVITRPFNFTYNLNFEKTKKEIELFMTTFYDPPRRNANIVIESLANFEAIQDFKTYLDESNYLIALRENVCYFASRKVFDKIYQLGIKYGESKTYNIDHYWWNAESQLKSICMDNHIDYYTSISTLEELPYNPDHYNKLINSDEVFYFLKRV